VAPHSYSRQHLEAAAQIRVPPWESAYLSKSAGASWGWISHVLTKESLLLSRQRFGFHCLRIKNWKPSTGKKCGFNVMIRKLCLIIQYFGIEWD
jgi:hypothetical protein